MNAMGGVFKNWYSADELAALALPGLPKSKRKINERAAAEQWALRQDAQGAPLVRRRAGKGGGAEYHVSVLPASARAELAKRAGSPSIIVDLVSDAHPIAANDEIASSAWTWFDRQTEKVKAEARRRMAIVEHFWSYVDAGLTRSAAAAQTAADKGVGSSTLWEWLRAISGLAATDWLPALAPRRKGGGAEAEIHPEIWTFFKSDYLRPEKPTYAECYRRAQEIAEAQCIPIPIVKTFQRKLEREVDPRVVIMLREGQDALRRAMPAQRRTVKALGAMELVNVDGHKFDVFVQHEGRIFRPIMVAIQDVMSRKILAYRIGEVESAILTRLAFADLFRLYGIPKGCLLDNGRAFASKWITGGALSRFRFKIREEEPTGLLPALGINPHWATPYRGQSKPIERGFRDLCGTISRHPALAGAYTGNSPDAKPDNYGSRAVPLVAFMAQVARGIAAHNAQRGRRTEMANGRSFDDVFAESYAVSAVGKASEAQLRLALLAGENRRVNRQTGHIELMGNRYWSPDLSNHYGKIVTVRFDPDNLHQAVHVYDLQGQFLCSPDLLEDTGFLDAAAARGRAKLEANWRKTVRAAADMEQLLTAAQLADLLPAPREAQPLPEPTVIRPVRHRGQVAAALKPAVAESQQEDFIGQFAASVASLRLVE